MTGLQHALCALSFYRARNQRKKRFAHATKPHNQQTTVGQRARMVYLARQQIRLARALGWRGSVVRALDARIAHNAPAPKQQALL